MDFADPQQRRIFFELHSGLPREGPGNRDSTARALAMAQPLPPAPRVLDIACGPGMQTLDLADLLPDAQIVAVDLHEPFLEALRQRAAAAGAASRVEALRADMAALPFAPGSFDLIWCEGAAYIMGVGNALRTWRPLLRPDGKLALTEAVWLKPGAPEPVQRAFAEYPAMSGVEAKRRLVADCGYDLLGDFILPERAWRDNYYAPMEERLADLLQKYTGDSVATAVLAENREEIELFKLHSGYYGYVFLVTARSR
ncbi:MAG TPA: class I SAM-dependent methyltransferase [Dongiaceae bacterium]|jgi:SAM-dependent methyltransferase